MKKAATYKGTARRRQTKKKGCLYVLCALLILALCASGLFILFTSGVLNGISSSSKQESQNSASSSSSSFNAPTVSDRMAKTEAQDQEISAEKQTEVLRIRVVGDMMFSRNIGRNIEQGKGDKHLSQVKELLRDADLTIANLENPLWKYTPPAPPKKKEEQNPQAGAGAQAGSGAKAQTGAQAGTNSKNGTKNDSSAQVPEKIVLIGHPQAKDIIKDAGIDMVSLANNHLMDGGSEGLIATLENLDAAGIAYTGAGRNLQEAMTPATSEIKGHKIAYLAVSNIIPGGYAASSNKAGIAPGRTQPKAVLQAIKSLKAAHDVVLVSIHWGTEYADKPSAQQVSFAHQCIEAGADALLCAHPHVLQGFELYKGKLIAYSLGDFLFDIYHSKADESVICELEFNEQHELSAARLLPILIKPGAIVSIPDPTRSQEILKRLNTLSSAFNTSIAFEGDKIGQISGS